MLQISIIFHCYVYANTINISIFVPVPYCSDYCNFIVSFISGSMILSILFFLKIYFTILDLISVYKNFRFSCSNSEKNEIGILVKIVLNLYIALGNKSILTTLIFPTHEQGISFHLFVSYLNIFQCSIVLKL